MTTNQNLCVTVRWYLDILSTYQELGVGGNTPVIIKYPFWEMTSQWKKSFYVCINLNEAWAPEEIRRKSLCIDGDIKEILSILKEC